MPSWHSWAGVVPNASCMTLFLPQISRPGRNVFRTSLRKLFLSLSMETKCTRLYFSAHSRISSMSSSFFSFGRGFVFVRLTTLLRLDLGIAKRRQGANEWLEGARRLEAASERCL